MSVLGSSFALTGMTDLVSGQSTQTVDIITEISGDGTRFSTSVPKPWYMREQQAGAAMNAAKKTIGSKECVVSLGRVITEKKVAGRKVTTLSARVTDSSVTLPEAVDGIPLKKEIAPKTGANDGCHFSGNYSTINGGVELEESGYFTACSRVTMGGEEYIITTNHQFGCGDNTGTNVYQDGDYTGQVALNNDEMDYALIEIDGSESVNNVLRVSGSTNETIYGHFTENGLLDLMSTDTIVRKQGSSTGDEQGLIARMYQENTYGDTPCVHLYESIETTINNAGGDSGGPVYANSNASPGDVSIAALHSGHLGNSALNGEECNSDLYSESIDVPAYRHYRDNNIRFGKGGTDGSFA